MAQHERKPAWKVQVPSSEADAAEKAIQQQWQEGKISKGTADSALKMIRKHRTRGVVYDSENKAKKVARQVKNSKVVPGTVGTGGFEEGKYILGCGPLMIWCIGFIGLIIAAFCLL